MKNGSTSCGMISGLSMPVIQSRLQIYAAAAAAAVEKTTARVKSPAS
jgi:hypothetical protein